MTKTTKLYQNATMEVSDVKKVHTMLMLLMKQFSVKPKVMPIVTICKATNDSPQSLLKGDAETLTNGTEVIVPKIRISPAITDNARKVANALAHNVVHLAMPSPFIKGTKHNDDFRKKAEELGFICEKKADDPNRNHLWTEVSLKDEQYNELVQAMGGEVAFNFVAIEKESKPSKPKTEKFYYVHPNGQDFVVSDNGNLTLFVEWNGKAERMKLDTNGTLMAEVKMNRAQAKRLAPNPEARQQTIA